MTPGQILAEAAARVRGAYGQQWVGRFPRNAREVCASRAIADAAGRSRVVSKGTRISPAELRARKAVEAELGASLVKYNDTPGRTQEEVAVLIENAKRHLAPEDV